MIFNVNTSGEKLILPTLNPSYPANVNVSFDYGESTSATFTAVISTDGKPAVYTYQWFVDGVEIIGATDPTYTMDDITTAGVQYVWCVVTNKAGSVETKHATLTATENYRTPVLDANYPADVTANYYKNETTSATFEVVIDAAYNPEDYTYQWYYDNEVVDGATSSTYTKTDINADGTHSVYCVVTNASGATVQSITATLTSVQVEKYLFKAGDQFTSLTGGWVAVNSGATTGSVWTDDYYGSASVNSADMQVRTSKFVAGCYGGRVHTTNKIDVTNNSTLTCECTVYGRAYVALLPNVSDTPTSGKYAYKSTCTYTQLWDTWTGNLTIDVSSLTGSYYVVIVAGPSETHDNMYTTISSIKLD